MKTFEHKVKASEGIHARPAGLLAKLVKEMNASVIISKGGKSADAGKLLSLMNLGVRKDDIITVTISNGEDTVYEKIKNFMDENF